MHWGEERGRRADQQAGRSYGPRGPTPVIAGTGQRLGCHRISMLTHRGRLACLVLGQRFTARVFLRFRRRLLRHAGRRVFLIVDRHPVHQARVVRRGRTEHAAPLRRFWWPPYSPEWNPEELLNQEGKSNAGGRRRPADRQEWIDRLRSDLESTPRRADKVRRYVPESQVRYAA